MARLTLFLSLVFIVAGNISAEEPIQFSAKEYIDKQVGDLQKTVETTYQTGINSVNVFLGVLTGVATLLSLVGVGGILGLRSSVKKDLEEIRRIREEVSKNSSATATLYEKLTPNLEKLERIEKNLAILTSTFENLFTEELTSRAKTLDESLFLDVADFETMERKISFLERTTDKLDEETLFLKAVLAYNERNYDLSIVVTTELLDRFSSKPLYNFLLGVIYQSTERHDEAIKYYSIAIQQSPTFYRAIVNKALSQKARGMVSDAAQLLRQAIGIDPGQSTAWVNLFDLLIDTRNIDGARVLDREIGTMFPDDSDYRYNKICLHVILEEYDSAFETAREVLTDPKYRTYARKDEILAPLFEKEERFRNLLKA